MKSRHLNMRDDHGRDDMVFKRGLWLIAIAYVLLLALCVHLGMLS